MISRELARGFILFTPRESEVRAESESGCSTCPAKLAKWIDSYSRQ